MTSARTHYLKAKGYHMNKNSRSHYSKGKPVDHTRLRYTFSHNTKILVRTEIKLYTLASFFADFGGYLGLLLGESLVSYLLRASRWIKRLKQSQISDKIEHETTKEANTAEKVQEITLEPINRIASIGRKHSENFEFGKLDQNVLTITNLDLMLSQNSQKLSSVLSLQLRNDEISEP